jgi:hypothetical protein
MHTPRPSADSPDRLVFDDAAVEVWNDHDAAGTEDTEGLDERLGKLGIGLGTHPGADEASIQFILEIEQLLPKYRALYGRWLQQDPELNVETTMARFAEENLVNMRADLFPSLTELKTHVYALGKFLGRPFHVSRAVATEILGNFEVGIVPRRRGGTSGPQGKGGRRWGT